uniref:Fucosyltransferase n=1 Tax=Globodera rostochiensis TaxID=31243 RepID=A0A914I2L6_GLORO
MNLHDKKLLLSFFAGFSIIGLFYYLYANYAIEFSLIYSEEAADWLNNFNDSKVPIVILWNNECIGDTMISLLDRGFPAYLPITAQYKCPFKCEYTANRSLEENSSMLIFHVHGSCLIDYWPKKRHPNQNYVMFTVESPLYTQMYFNQNIMTDTFFNTTVTYQTDSTVFMPYDSLVRITAATPIGDRWTEDEIFMVSHCEANSGRDFLTKALQGMLNLDLYGHCGGGRSCDTNCYNSEMDNHLFYFAFENSVCPQYITEKFWRSLRKLTIPVVLRRAVFSGIDIPPNAFIAADDFGTVNELAQYLISLQNDTARHLNHFEWTKTYRKSPYNKRQFQMVTEHVTIPADQSALWCFFCRVGVLSIRPFVTVTSVLVSKMPTQFQICVTVSPNDPVFDRLCRHFKYRLLTVVVVACDVSFVLESS